MEEWKDIIGYEGLYQISNHGRVMTLSRTYSFGIDHSASNKIHTHVLIPFHSHKNPYPKVELCLDGKVSTTRVHRLVAIHFIPNPENKRQVNHKDGNKQNNHVLNLEWNTSSEDTLHAWRTGLNKGNTGQTWELGPNIKRLQIISSPEYLSLLENLKKMKRVLPHGSQSEIGRMVGLSKHVVSHAFKGKISNMTMMTNIHNAGLELSKPQTI